MEKNLDDGNGLQGSFSQKQTKSKTSAWLVLLDRDVFERWCAFARDLGLSPGRLAPVLLDVAMGLSPLPLRGDVVRTRSRSASNEEAKKAAAICTEAGEASTTVSVCDIKEESTNPEDGNLSARLIVTEEDLGEVSTSCTSISCMEGLGVVDEQDSLAPSQSKTRMPIETENKGTGSLELSAVDITQDVLRSIPDYIDDDDDEADGNDNNKDEGTGRQTNNADQEIDLKRDGVEVEEAKRHVTKRCGAKQEEKLPERMCPFCNIFLKGTLSRHIWIKHRDREEVINASKLPRKERLRQFDRFKKEGIFKANQALAMAGEENTEFDREKRDRSKAKLEMCGKCKGFYSSIYIGTHKKRCRESRKKLNDVSVSLLMADPNDTSKKRCKGKSSKLESEEDYNKHLSVDDDDDVPGNCIPHQSSGPADDSHTLRSVHKDNGPMEYDRSENQTNNADQETIAIDLKQVDDEEEEGKRHVTKKEKKRPERLCPFCNTFLKGKLSRHILRKHREREEVINASKLPRKERLLQFDKFKKEGIFKANKALAIAGEDNIDFYRERRHRSKVKLVMCGKCKGFYSSNTIRRHKKGCEMEPHKKLCNVPVSRLIPYQDRAEDQSFSQDVLGLMKNDEIGVICRTDPMIATIGRQLWQEGQQTFSKRKELKAQVVRSMKQLASLYLITKEIENEVGLFEELNQCAVDMLLSRNFKHLASALEIYCQNPQGEVKTSVKQGLYFSLKKAAKIMKAYYLMEDKDGKAGDMDNFLEVLSANRHCLFSEEMDCRNKSRKGKSRIKAKREEDDTEDLSDDDD